MKKTMLGILCVLFALMLPAMASADNDGTNSRCHDTDRGIDPYAFGFVRTGSLYMEDKCIIDDNGIAVVHESYCADFDGWCYYAGVSRTVRYPSFEYAGYMIDVSEIGNDYAVFHILREGEDKEYRISVGEVKHTNHGIIIRLDNLEPEREGVAYSLANEYFKTDAYLCTGGCYAGACIGNLTPMDVAASTCSAPKLINFVTPANVTTDNKPKNITDIKDNNHKNATDIKENNNPDNNHKDFKEDKYIKKNKNKDVKEKKDKKKKDKKIKASKIKPSKIKSSKDRNGDAGDRSIKPVKSLLKKSLGKNRG